MSKLATALATSALALALALPLAPAGAAAGAAPARPLQDGIDFELHAKAFMLDHGLTGLDASTVDLHAALRERWTHVDLGLFEVLHPTKDLEDKETAKVFANLCSLLVGVQADWLEMTAAGTEPPKGLEAAMKTLAKWVDGWSPRALADAAAGAERDLLVALEPSRKELEAAQLVREAFVSGTVLGTAREGGTTSPIVLCPTRREFVRLVCFAGYQWPAERPNYWAPNLHEWIEGRIMDLRVLALEYVDTEADPGDVYRGMPMNGRRGDEREQHVVQRAFLSLAQNAFGDRLDPALAVGLAINVDIDLFGLDHARLEGDPRGSSTPPREVFVPGGNPNGGFLPPLNAESRFREEEGKGRYVHALAMAQSAGDRPEQSEDAKLRSFELQSDAGIARVVVFAPFFGAGAIEAPMPSTRFVGDYMELFRAYRTAFVHWLRDEAGSSRKDSRKRFGRLLAALAADPEATLADVVPLVYDGDTLSGTPPGPESLEGRFLRWLPRQL